MTPGGLTFQATPRRRALAYPPLSGPGSTWRSVPRYGAVSDRSTGDARLAHRDHAAWAAGTALRASAGHRTNRPRVSPRPVREALTAYLRGRLPPSPHSSALERALGWDGAI